MFQMVQSQLSDLELIVKTTLAEHILMEFAFFGKNWSISLYSLVQVQSLHFRA